MLLSEKDIYSIIDTVATKLECYSSKRIPEMSREHAVIAITATLYELASLTPNESKYILYGKQSKRNDKR